MSIEIIDTLEVARREKKRTVVMNTRKMHAWVHYYPTPGDHDDMHCHNADQTFYVIEGECTMRFPDGGAAVLTPGKAALIRGGSFYQLENSGSGPMIMMGTRSGSQEDIKHINYETRKDLRAEGVERMHHRE
ncbi:MAG TPA: cupin domain-containing protein [Alphaproteobacteria bacterium]|jgi:mannose-6-phosphate isomerase-like protein (cupin superfamily)|nr:cupin domain-containing protein [Alphaproteobacteria bacterium]